VNSWHLYPKHILLLVGLLSLFICDAYSQINLQKDSITKKGKLRKIFGFPAVIYSPETTLAFGGAGNFYFKLSKDSSVRTSYIQGLALYTLRGQAVFGSEGAIFFSRRKIYS